MNEATQRYLDAVSKFADKCHKAAMKSKFAPRTANFDICISGDIDTEEELWEIYSPKIDELSSYIYYCALVGIDKMRVRIMVNTNKVDEDMDYIVNDLMTWCQQRRFGYVVHTDNSYQTTINIIW